MHAGATSRCTKLGLAQALIIHEIAGNAQSGRRWHGNLLGPSGVDTWVLHDESATDD